MINKAAVVEDNRKTASSKSISLKTRQLIAMFQIKETLPVKAVNKHSWVKLKVGNGTKENLQILKIKAKSNLNRRAQNE